MSRRAAPAAPASTLPASLASYTAVQIKALKQNILTEHFNFAPESFAKQGMDVVNVAMYAATEVLETSLLDRLAQQEQGGEGTIQLDEDAIQEVCCFFSIRTTTRAEPACVTTGNIQTRNSPRSRDRQAFRPL